MTPSLRLLLQSSAAFLTVACVAWLLRHQPGFAPSTQLRWLALAYASSAAIWSLASSRGLWLCLPAAAACLAYARAPQPPASSTAQEKPIRFRATLLSSAPLREGGYLLRVRSHAGSVRVSCRSSARSPPPIDSQLVLCGTLIIRYGYLSMKGCQVQAIPNSRAAPTNYFASIRNVVRTRLRSNLGEAATGWAEALLLGDARRAPVYLPYRDLGLLHLLAISGLHFWLWWAILFRALPHRARKSRLAALFFIAILGGWTASVTRAGIALFLRECCASRGWHAPALALWACALWTEVSFFRPHTVSLGLCLSYLATAVLIICHSLAARPSSLLGQTAVASAAATLATAPLLHTQGASFSLLSVPLSPLVGLLLPFKLLVSALGLLPGLAPLLSACMQGLTVIEVQALDLLNRLPGTPWRGPTHAVLNVTPAAFLSCGLLFRRHASSLSWSARSSLLLLVWLAALSPRSSMQEPVHAQDSTRFVVSEAVSETLWKELLTGQIRIHHQIEFKTSKLAPVESSLLLAATRAKTVTWSASHSPPDWLLEQCEHYAAKLIVSPK